MSFIANLIGIVRLSRRTIVFISLSHYVPPPSIDEGLTLMGYRHSEIAELVPSVEFKIMFLHRGHTADLLRIFNNHITGIHIIEWKLCTFIASGLDWHIGSVKSIIKKSNCVYMHICWFHCYNTCWSLAVVGTNIKVFNILPCNALGRSEKLKGLRDVRNSSKTAEAQFMLNIVRPYINFNCQIKFEAKNPCTLNKIENILAKWKGGYV